MCSSYKDISRCFCGFTLNHNMQCKRPRTCTYNDGTTNVAFLKFKIYNSNTLAISSNKKMHKWWHKWWHKWLHK